MPTRVNYLTCYFSKKIMPKNYGIYLVANKKSQNECKNLVYSIRKSGCNLPITIIHFGGEKIDSNYLLQEAKLIDESFFSSDASSFLKRLSLTLDQCPLGYLKRFLSFYGEYDYFIYSDNDVVALSNWSNLFDLIEDNQLLHSDEEYKTNGRYNFHDTSEFIQQFGDSALEYAITAGHFLAKKDLSMVQDMLKALEWIDGNSKYVRKHDQTMLHIASLIGSWKTTNLCKSPYNWLSSWAYDYKNTLHLIQSCNRGGKISHLHYSGSPLRILSHPTHDLLFSSNTKDERSIKYIKHGLMNILFFGIFFKLRDRLKSKLKY